MARFDRDPHDPRRRVPFAGEPVPPHARAGARFLGDVFGFGTVTEEAERGPVGVRVQAREGRGERLGEPSRW